MTNKKIYFDEALIGLLLVSLGAYYLFPSTQIALIILGGIGIIPVLISAVKALIKREITIDLLASIALIFTLIGHQWVSAAFINLMLACARLFEAFTERKTEDVISKLLKLRPQKVTIQAHGEVHVVDLDEVKVGDMVVIESGTRVPIDGVVVKGQASIDQSTLTGESEPLLKKEGSKVFSSTLCLSGSLVVRAEKVGADTTLSKMIALVDEASRAKTKTETIAGRFSTWYISIMLIVSGVLYFTTHNLSLVLGVLLVTCADDIAVAVPLGFTVAISKAARNGIVVKGARVMERAKDITTIVTDKTGTLTRGSAKVLDVEISGNEKKEIMLKAALFSSIDSQHPVSKAIAQYVEAQGVLVHAPDEVHEYPGEGIMARHGGHTYAQGKPEFIERLGGSIDHELKTRAKNFEEKGNSVSFISVDKKVAGFFVLEDDIRPFAKEVIQETRNLGVKRWIMLTGDNNKVAEKVAKTLGIEEYYANLKPEDKLDIIKKLRHKHGAVAMVGDGVNDAAALALADVSFAMGAIGSDASIEAADIALMRDDLRRIPESIFLSQESIRIVKQNFIIWVITNVIGLALVFGGFIGPVGASAYNFLTDFLPILNVFQIYRLKINRHTYDVKNKIQ